MQAKALSLQVHSSTVAERVPSRSFFVATRLSHAGEIAAGTRHKRRWEGYDPRVRPCARSVCRLILRSRRPRRCECDGLLLRMAPQGRSPLIPLAGAKARARCCLGCGLARRQRRFGLPALAGGPGCRASLAVRRRPPRRRVASRSSDSGGGEDGGRLRDVAPRFDGAVLRRRRSLLRLAATSTAARRPVRR